MQTGGDWNDYLFFLKVAEYGSLKSAANHLGVNHSTVFRRIKRLEKKLNIRLFERLKSGYTLTRAGEEILSNVQEVDEQIYSIQRRLLGQDTRLSGTLKLSTTDTLGYYWLPPYIRKFKELYPDILVDMDVTTRYTNLTKREADVVIPAVNMQPDYMVGRKLFRIKFKLYATEKYLEKRGELVNLKTAAAHRFLLPNDSLEGLPANKWMRKKIQETTISASSDKITALYKLAQQHMGIACLPHYIGEIDSSLVEILELPSHCHHDVWILTHPDLRHTARVKTFMQFMYKEIQHKSTITAFPDF